MNKPKPTTHLFFRTLILGVGGIALSACTTLQQTSITPESTPATSSSKLDSRPLVKQTIERDTLFNILSGEMAARRMLGKQASEHMLAAMERQPDRALAIRTAKMAHYFKDDTTLENATLAWQRFAPQAVEPRYLRAVALTRQGRLDEAMALMEALNEQGEEASFTAVVSSVTEHPEQADKLSKRVTRLRQRFPQNIQLILSGAILADAAGEAETALNDSDSVLVKAPDNFAALHIKARSLQILKRQDEAIDTLIKALEIYPETINMRLHLARMLTRTDLVAASEQFAILVEQAPQDANFRLSLALSLKETDRLDDAKQHFNTLLDMGKYTDESNYYLAHIYKDDSPELAANFALEISRDSHYFMSGLALFLDIKGQQGELMSGLDTLQTLWLPEDQQTESIVLLAAQKLSDIGMQSETEHVLRRAITTLKNQIEVRYTLALLVQQQGKLAEAQTLLEQNIQAHPEHVASLNALGYLMAENNHDLERAETLIAQAIELSPNDAAIIDSLGWVRFKQGNPEQAAKLLAKAHHLLADPEIASHLIEVLWYLNRRVEASDIVNDALQRFPDSPKLNDTLQRLNIPRQRQE